VETTRRGRFWVALGGPKAVRTIYVIMLFYALVLGGLMLGYADVQKCLADYSDQNALATKARADAGTDDRLLNQRVAAVDQSDRIRIIENQQALAELAKAAALGQGNTTAARDALAKFQRTSDVSLEIFRKNQEERTSIAQARAAIDKKRSDNPVPSPPSEQC
jgi:multidrug efflux pump subunit AcrB